MGSAIADVLVDPVSDSLVVSLTNGHYVWVTYEEFGTVLEVERRADLEISRPAFVSRLRSYFEQGGREIER